mgnify:CR=1 FL=1
MKLRNREIQVLIPTIILTFITLSDILVCGLLRTS